MRLYHASQHYCPVPFAHYLPLKKLTTNARARLHLSPLQTSRNGSLLPSAGPSTHACVPWPFGQLVHPRQSQHGPSMTHFWLVWQPGRAGSCAFSGITPTNLDQQSTFSMPSLKLSGEDGLFAVRSTCKTLTRLLCFTSECDVLLQLSTTCNLNYSPFSSLSSPSALLFRHSAWRCEHYGTSTILTTTCMLMPLHSVICRSNFYAPCTFTPSQFLTATPASQCYLRPPPLP